MSPETLDVERLREQVGAAFSPRSRAAVATADDLCLHLCFKIVREHGLFTREGSRETSETLRRAIGHVRDADYLVARVVDILRDEGYVRALDGGGLACVRPVPANALPSLYAAADEQFPNEPFFRFVERCERGVFDFLAGVRRGRDVIFPRGDLSLWTELHNESLVMGPYAEAVAPVVAALTGEQAELLEFGAGTGAGTAHLLRLLEGRDIARYTYTDLGDAFLALGRRRFASHPFMDYAQLDLDSDAYPVADQSVDIAFGVNALHVARSLPRAVRRLVRAVAPGGWIVVSEGSPPAPDRSWRPNVLFGLLDGWWNVETDPEFRPQPGFLTPARWVALFRRCGLVDVQNLTAESGGTCFGGVVFGRVPATAP